MPAKLYLKCRPANADWPGRTLTIHLALIPGFNFEDSTPKYAIVNLECPIFILWCRFSSKSDH